MPDQFAEQLKKLQALRHHSDADSTVLDAFDAETEQLLIRTFGESTDHLEAYELAMMGEAETIVNMPQAAQEDATQDLFHKGLEQRRQVLEGCLAELQSGAGRPAPAKLSSPVQKKSRAAKTKPRAAKKKGTTTKKKKTVARKPAKKKKAGPARRKKRQ